MLCMCMCKIHIATIGVLGKSALLAHTNMAVSSAPSVESPWAGHPGNPPPAALRRRPGCYSSRWPQGGRAHTGTVEPRALESRSPRVCFRGGPAARSESPGLLVLASGQPTLNYWIGNLRRPRIKGRTNYWISKGFFWLEAGQPARPVFTPHVIDSLCCEAGCFSSTNEHSYKKMQIWGREESPGDQI